MSPWTPESRAKFSASQRARRVTPETKAKMSMAWTPEMRARQSERARNRTVPLEVRAKISSHHARHTLGKKLSQETRRKMSEHMKGRIPWNKGKRGAYKMSEANRRAMAQRMKGLRAGEKSPMWRGGVTPLRTRVWRSDAYRQWRDSVFLRDRHTCRKCGATSGKGIALRLEADHYPIPFVVLLDRAVKTWPVLDPFDAAMNDKRLWKAKGRTLCWSCHNATKRGRHTMSEYLAKSEELQLARYQH